MKVAVAYENGNVAEHFGHAEEYKIYMIHNGKILRAGIFPVAEGGHEEVVKFLDEYVVDVVICGGIGFGAIDALNRFGILVFGDVKGSADQAVADFLEDKLEPTKVPTCHDGSSCAAHGCTHPCH